MLYCKAISFKQMATNVTFKSFRSGGEGRKKPCRAKDMSVSGGGSLVEQLLYLSCDFAT